MVNEEKNIEYERSALKYKPEKKKLKYLFIAESPPYGPTKDGKPRYFYFDDVAEKDNLLRYIIKGVFSEEYNKTNKKRWLSELRDNGFFLIDAVEYPIDNLPEGKERNDHIKKNIPILIEKIKDLVNNNTKIILIKRNIFEILIKKLKTPEFNVINKKLLPFPSRGWQNKFSEELSELLKIN
ncbi:MAG: hypothetical protein ACTSP9_05050 [Promethearchaeota archaeon]